MVDWSAGSYEVTAAELEPVAQAVVEMAAPLPRERVLDLACGTGNAALLAAARGASVIGVDSARRLLDVARERARSLGTEVDFRDGDLLELPVDDDAAEVVLSVFGLIFAPDPSRAMREVARVLSSGGRVLFTAWVPAGPIDATLAALGRVLRRVTQESPPQRFPWSDATAVGSVASDAGLVLQNTTATELAIRHSSPEACFAAVQHNPMALAARQVLERAGAEEEAREAALAVLREANEDPAGFLVHSPYVVHEMLAGTSNSQGIELN